MRVYSVWWVGPGIYVPRPLVTGAWAWVLWEQAEPPIAGTFIESRDVALRLEGVTQ